MAEAEMRAKTGPAEGGGVAAAVAARCAHHRAGAQYRAVSRPGAADHARPAEVDRRRATGGARPAPGRHPAAARSPRSPIRPPIDMHRMGTLANIVRYITAPDGSHHLVCQGEQRFQVVEYLSGWPFFVARVLRIPEPDVRTPEIEARFVNLKAQALEAVQLLPQAPAELLAAIQSIETPAALADLAIAYMDVKPEEKQEILETIDIVARMDKVLAAAGASHRGAAAVAGDRPADQGVARRAPARGAAARADGGDPAPARRRRGGQGRRDGRARRGHQQSRHAEGGRGRRRARNCAGCSACRKPPANTAWCAPISTG